MEITLEKLSEITHGCWLPTTPVGRVRRVSTDSRTVDAGDLFFAIRGDRFDGHQFVAEARKRGAVAAVTERELAESPGIPVLRVKDSIDALSALAQEHRRTLKGTVIAITGSNGKTTTKDMVHHVLSRGARTTKSHKSFNNHIGVPLTLLSASPNDDFIVVEVGTNHAGEIARLAALVLPSVAVVTNVAESHLGGLGSVEGVAREKESLLASLSEEGVAVLNADNEHTCRMASRARFPVITFGLYHDADLRGNRVDSQDGKLRFWANDRVEFVLPVLGGWNAYNALAAAAVARHLGLDLDEVAARLADFRPAPMRMEYVEVSGVRFVNDAYNANPASTLLALDQFDMIECAGDKVVVLGEMKELGDHSKRLHARIGERVGRMQVDLFLAIGRGMGAAVEAARATRGPDLPIEHVDTVEEASVRLQARLRPGDLVLLKGSRAMGLERILQRFAGDSLVSREAACSPPPSSRPI